MKGFAGYHISRASEKCCLPVDISCAFSVLDGKSVGPKIIDGRCVRLSHRLAIIESMAPPPSLADVKLWLRDSREPVAECYGKAARDGGR